MASKYFYGTGRRKSSVARVRLLPGTGKLIVNRRTLEDYFGLDTLQLIIMQPFSTIGADLSKYDVIVTVHGGGVSGQAGAVRMGISRALLDVDKDYRLPLKKAGFLTRDSRTVERKKYGLKKARKSPQFSKR